MNIHLQRKTLVIILHSKLSQIKCHNCAFFCAVKHLSKKKVQIIELKHCFVQDDGDLVNDWTVEVNQLVVMRANCLV